LVLTLHIMRHAKSDWSAHGLSDKQRLLNERGLHAASQMGGWMRRHQIKPDIILCSSAIRTQQTLQGLITGGLAIDRKVILDDLYLASTRTATGLINQHGSAHKSLMLIGHNPMCHELSAGIAIENTKGCDPLLLSKISNSFPTGALASIEITANIWTNWDANSGRLKRFMRPKDIV